MTSTRMRLAAGFACAIVLVTCRSSAPAAAPLAWQVVPGRAYRYRGRFSDESGEHVTASSAEVPRPGSAPRLAIALRGRRVARRASDGAAGERRAVVVDAPGGLPSGLYFARVRQGTTTAQVRVVRL